MNCVLLWHIAAHYLYRCSSNVPCEIIDQTLYICNSTLPLSTTSGGTTYTTTIPPVVSTAKSTIFSTSTSIQVRTSTQISATTTTPSPSPTTTTYLNPTSTYSSTTLSSNRSNNLSTTTAIVQTTTRINYNTTTDNQLQNLTTSPSINETTTSTYTTDATEASTTTHVNNTTPYIETTTTLKTTTISAIKNDTSVHNSTTTYSPSEVPSTTKKPPTTTVIPSTTEITSTVETTTQFPTTSTVTTTTQLPTTSTVKTTTQLPTTGTVKTTEFPTTTEIISTSYTTTTHKIQAMTTTPISKKDSTTHAGNRSETKNLRSTKSQLFEKKNENFVVPIIIFSILLIGGIGVVTYKVRSNQNKTGVVPTTVDEPLDPIIENILEEQDLKNQLRINKWRMARLHKYLKKKYPKKQGLVKHMEKNPSLMEKIHIQIKNSPVQIYKKRGKKRDAIPTLKADLIPKQVPTMKVDLMTALKEPDKIKHISSVAKLKIKMLPVLYEHRRKRKNFKPLKEMLLPVHNKPKRPRRKAPSPPKSELEVLKNKKLVSNSVFKAH